MKVLVSACLLGENCKYNGKNNYNASIVGALDGHTIIPICPEQMGGLPTPRNPSEIVDGVVTMRTGENVDAQFREGARRACEIALREGATHAILQSRSPSCGVKQVYDGTFTGTLIPGQGICAKALADIGIMLIDAEDFSPDLLAISN